MTRHVKAELGLDASDSGKDLLPHGLEEAVGLERGKCRGAVEMEDVHGI